LIVYPQACKILSDKCKLVEAKNISSVSLVRLRKYIAVQPQALQELECQCKPGEA